MTKQIREKVDFMTHQFNPCFTISVAAWNTAGWISVHRIYERLWWIKLRKSRFTSGCYGGYLQHRRGTGKHHDGPPERNCKYIDRLFCDSHFEMSLPSHRILTVELHFLGQTILVNHPTSLTTHCNENTAICVICIGRPPYQEQPEARSLTGSRSL